MHRSPMATSITIKNPVTGLVKEGKIGFSWTYFFFGWFVPLFRGEVGIAALHLLFSCVTFGLWQIIMAFLYNKQYMHRMIEKGYVLADTDARNSLARSKLGLG